MERRLAELAGEDNKLLKQELVEAKVRLHRKLIDDLNLPMLERLSREELRVQISEVVSDYVRTERILLNARELETFTTEVLDELTGLGPIEPLLKDPTVSDILINTHERVYVERYGQLEQVPVRFKDEAHVLRIVNKIVSAVGRRVDEFPADGRRASRGWLAHQRRGAADRGGRAAGVDPQIRRAGLRSRRPGIGRQPDAEDGGGAACGGPRAAHHPRFRRHRQRQDDAAERALDRISHKERLITIEDAAELRLQQPHVGRLETRPPNIEGRGEIRQRELVKNALRMRPDRIIIGEVRGEEAFDMLQAMNTGHEGSMTTIHANTPRDALARLTQMVGMAGLNMTETSVRAQIASAITHHRAASALYRRPAPGGQHHRDHRDGAGCDPDAGDLQIRPHRDGDRWPGSRRVPRDWTAPVLHAGAAGPRLQLRDGLLRTGGREMSAPPARTNSGVRRGAPSGYGGVPHAVLRKAQRNSVGRRLGTTDVVDTSRRAEASVQGRSLSPEGDYSLPFISLNQLILQSGVTFGVQGVLFAMAFLAVGAYFVMAIIQDATVAVIVAVAVGAGFPVMILRGLRTNRQRKFEEQLPEAIDIIVRGLKAGHAIPVAIATVGQQTAEPLGGEFAITGAELTYGLDLETAMVNLRTRVGQADLALLVLAVSIQAKMGGNLAEILRQSRESYPRTFQATSQGPRPVRGRALLRNVP